MFVEIQKELLRPDGPCPLPFVLCNIGSSLHQAPIHRPDGFHFHHLIWVAAGEGVFHADGQTRMLGKNQGLFCRKGTPHGYQGADPGFSTRWITFLGAEGAMDALGMPAAYFFRAAPSMDATIDSLDKLCMGSSTPLSRSAAGYSWLIDWMEEAIAPDLTPAQQIRQYLESNFARPLTLDQIAAQVGMDRFSLCRYYKENQGITVMAHLKRIRMAKAKQLLRYASCSVEEISTLCGYESPSYFGLLFRRETGRTPREYREAHRK